MNVADNEEERPLAWPAIRADTPVQASDGVDLGTVREVLGSEATDIFHGLVVSNGPFPHDAMIPADDVASITNKVIKTTLTAEEVKNLPGYVAEESYRLGFVGLLGRKLGWVEDKNDTL